MKAQSSLPSFISGLLALFIWSVAAEENVTVDFFRESVRLFEGQVLSIEFRSSVGFRSSIVDEKNAEIVNVSFSETANCSVFVRGKFIGHTMLRLEFNSTSEPSQLPVSVLRSVKSSRLTLLFSLVMGIFVFCNTFIMGLQLDWKVIMAVIKRPIAPVIGFLCQFGLMPMIATGYAFLLLSGYPALQFGYFTVGCSPGGGPSNMWSLLLGGNLDLSITMTFFSSLAALGMMPFWLYTLGQVFYKEAAPGQKVSIPFQNLAISLILLICPVFLGILTRHFKPQWAEKSQKIVKLSSLIILLVAIPFGAYANLYLFSLITWRTILCGLALPWSGFVFGYLAGWLFKQDMKNRKTIAIETGFQNASIAIIIMNVSLPKPDGDMAIVMPLCVLIFTPIPMFVLLIIKVIREKIEKRRKPTGKVGDAAQEHADKSIATNKSDGNHNHQENLVEDKKLETSKF